MPARSKAVKQPSSSHAELSLERLVFFSDAVMAIAITLLAIDLKIPELSGVVTSARVWQELVNLAPRFMSFLISFMVIGVYWNSHHRYMNLVTRVDGRLSILNMIFLLFIALMPFVSGLFGQYSYLPIGSAVYASAISLTGFSMKAIWSYVTHQPQMLKPEVDAEFIRRHNLVLLLGPLTFMISIPLAWVSFNAVIIAWFITPLATFIITRRFKLKSAK